MSSVEARSIQSRIVLVPWTPIAWPQYTAGLLEAERERPLTPAEERAWRSLVERLRVPVIAEEEQ